MMMVKTRPSAVSHYCSFLKQLHAWKELTTVYQYVYDTPYSEPAIGLLGCYIGTECMVHLSHYKACCCIAY